jgi:hypothetical protein
MSLHQCDRAPGGSDRLALLIEAREGFVETALSRLRSDLNLSPERRAQGGSKSVRVVHRR